MGSLDKTVGQIEIGVERSFVKHWLNWLFRFHLKQSSVQSLGGKIELTVYELNLRFLVIHFRLAAKRVVRKVEAKLE